MSNFTKTFIEWLILIEPKAFFDDRGFFMEIYNENEFKNNWIDTKFVQDNYSISKAWVLRWLHFQKENTQAKLVYVTRWSAYDVCVDLRKDSPTFWKYYSNILSWENKLKLFVPKWFAHGFLALEDNTEFLYKCDDFYNPAWDSWLLWDDEDLNINWWEYFPLDKIIISEKDKLQQSFKDFIKNNPF